MKKPTRGIRKVIMVSRVISLHTIGDYAIVTDAAGERHRIMRPNSLDASSVNELVILEYVRWLSQIEAPLWKQIVQTDAKT